MSKSASNKQRLTKQDKIESHKKRKQRKNKRDNWQLQA